MTERPLRRVPNVVLALLAATFIAQITLHAFTPRPTANAAALPWPPTTTALRIAALGEPIAMAQLLNLYLQAFDTQPGISIPFRDLDYDRVEAWLARILDLDPAGQYPLLMAAQVYSEVPDEGKQRQILDFVFREFQTDPVRRWRWLAQASILARHRLGDMPLALRYAEALARQANHPSVPSWARQMHVLLLADIGEREAAMVLLGGLLAGGTITDSHEIYFLSKRLHDLESGEISTPLSKRRHR